jgi:hypothetical protein
MRQERLFDLIPGRGAAANSISRFDVVCGALPDGEDRAATPGSRGGTERNGKGMCENPIFISKATQR